MSPWQRPNETLVELLSEIVAGIEFEQPTGHRLMFGCPSYFTGGNMFAGVWQDTVMLRLPEDDRAAVVAAGGHPFEPMPGRVMKQYVSLPAALAGDRATTAAWVRKAAAYAASLPPKEKSRRTKKR